MACYPALSTPARLEALGQGSPCFTMSFTTASAGGGRGARASRRAAVCCLPGHSHPGATTCPPGPTSICPPQHILGLTVPTIPPPPAKGLSSGAGRSLPVQKCSRTSTGKRFKSPGSLRVTDLWCSRICPAAASWWGRVRSSPGGLKFGLNPGCNLLRAVCTLPAMSNSCAVLSAWEGSRQGQPMEENHTHPYRSHVPCSLETNPTRVKPA